MPTGQNGRKELDSVVMAGERRRIWLVLTSVCVEEGAGKIETLVCVCLRAQCVCLCQIVFQDLRSKLFFHRLDEVATAPTAGAGRAGSSGFLGSAPMAARLLLHCL